MTNGKASKNLVNGIDQKMITRFVCGDKEAFSSIYDECSPTLFKLIFIKVNNISMAEKILEDCFVDAWNCRHQYNTAEDNIILWLFNISKQLLVG